ncbi:MAG: hypothetical protein Q8R28_11240 [Dehalococcoidia bacterium]|nr:hypothetical protein [Dehalococcoidia bacterium]
MLFVNGEQVVIQSAEIAGIPTANRGTLEVEGASGASLRLRDTSQTLPAGRFDFHTDGDEVSIRRAASTTSNPWDSTTTLWSAASSGAQTITATDTGANSMLTALTLNRNVDGAGVGAASLGVRLSLGLESTTTINTQAAAIDAVWTTATHATRTADLVLSTVISATLTEIVRLDGSKSSLTLPDNILLSLGTDGDAVGVLSSAGLAADTALANVLLLTTAGSRQALAANSLIVSNITASGDMGGYVNNAGTSWEWLLVDASALTISLGHGGFVSQFLAPGIGTTQTDRILLANTTVATVGAQQYSPSLHFQGQGWKTDAVAASQSVDVRIQLEPFQSNSSPLPLLVTQYAVNGGAYTTIAILDYVRLSPGVDNVRQLWGTGQTVTTSIHYQATIGARSFSMTGDVQATALNINNVYATSTDQVTKTTQSASIELDTMHFAASAGAVTFSNVVNTLVLFCTADANVTFTKSMGLDFYGATVHAGTVGTQIFIHFQNSTAATTNVGIAFVGTPNGGSIITEAAADLTFGYNSSIDLTLGANSLVYSKASSTSNSAFTVTNTSNAAAASHSYLEASVGGTTSTGDPQLRLTVPGGTSWYVGADNSLSNDPFFIGVGTAVGTTPWLRVDAASSGVWTSVWGGLITPANHTYVDGAANAFQGLVISTSTQTFPNTTPTKTSLTTGFSVLAVTIAQSGGAITVNKAAGIVSIGVTAGASVTLTHSSAFRALTGGAAVNVSGLYVEAQTAGTTGNYQMLLAVSTGAAPALADHVGLTARDFGADDTRLYIASQAGSDIILGNNSLNFVGAADIVVPAATAAALELSNGTIKVLALDTRATTDQMAMFTITGIAPTFAGVTASTYSIATIAALTVTLTGNASTPDAMNGLALDIGAVTLTDTTALTVDLASAVMIRGVVAAGSITITANYLINTDTAGCFLTAAGVWTDTSLRASKQDIAPVDFGQVLRDIQTVQSVTFRKRDPSDGGFLRYGVIADDVPDFLAMPGRQGIGSIYMAGAAFAGVQALIYENDLRIKAIQSVDDRVTRLERQLVAAGITPEE